MRPKRRGSKLRQFKTGERVVVRGRGAVFVKAWGSGAVVRYDDAPNEPKVVPLERVAPVAAVTADEGRR
jgi:hypothetical protein